LFVFSVHVTSTPELSTLSLHDALPIWTSRWVCSVSSRTQAAAILSGSRGGTTIPVSPIASDTPPTSVATQGRPQVMASITVYGKDRKSTRLNSSHLVISYAVFCLKKKK